MARFRTVLFDLDGTLTDSAPGITASVRFALKELGVTEYDESVLYKFIGPPLIWSFKEFFAMSDERAQKGLELYRLNYNERGGKYDSKLYDGLEESLRRMRDAGVRLGVATAKPEITAREVIEHFGLDKYFECVSGGNPDEKRCGKRDIILHAMDLLGEKEPAKTLMVGDREYDVTGAREAGVASLGVLYGFGTREELQNAGAEAFAASPEEIADYVLG